MAEKKLKYGQIYFKGVTSNQNMPASCCQIILGDDSDNEAKFKSIDEVYESFTSGKFINLITGGAAVQRIGVQALPGTKFTINSDDGNGIYGIKQVIVGCSGTYELNLVDKSSIKGIKMDPVSMYKINNNPLGYLIVDIAYEGVEGGNGE